MIILCVTQCSHGGVAAFYETGKVVKNFWTLLGLNSFVEVLMNAGAIPGLDITPEAALAKLAHVLSLPIRLAPLVIFENILTFPFFCSRKEQKELMVKNMRGEMSVKIQQV